LALFVRTYYQNKTVALVLTTNFWNNRYHLRS